MPWDKADIQNKFLNHFKTVWLPFIQEAVGERGPDSMTYVDRKERIKQKCLFSVVHAYVYKCIEWVRKVMYQTDDSGYL